MRPTFDGSRSASRRICSTLGWRRHRSGWKCDLEASPRREEFSGPEELRAQIARDIAGANKFFSRLRRFRSIRQPA